MTTITFKGELIHTAGELPGVGSGAPSFTLTKKDFTEIYLSDFQNKNIILNIFPSIDTPVCAASTHKFNQLALGLKNTKVITVSADLPFALNRFCAAEEIENIIATSTFRHPEFGREYGVAITDSSLAGLMSRAVVILDQSHNVIYTEQVSEITQEPNYDKAMEAISHLM